MLKLPLRGPQGSDLINIFYGEPLDVARSAPGSVLIIVRIHYGRLCEDTDSGLLLQRGREVTGTEIPDFFQGLSAIVQFH